MKTIPILFFLVSCNFSYKNNYVNDVKREIRPWTIKSEAGIDVDQNTSIPEPIWKNDSHNLIYDESGIPIGR